MRAEFAHEQAQTYLRQRNRFAVLAGVLGLTTLVSLGAAVSLALAGFEQLPTDKEEPGQ